MSMSTGLATTPGRSINANTRCNDVLTVEHNTKDESIEIFCDREGLELLMRKLSVLAEKGGHVHLMTPAWSGNELTEEKQSDTSELINHVVIALKPE
jgi:hypothetical protein